jgi:hypothetical protein
MSATASGIQWNIGGFLRKRERVVEIELARAGQIMVRDEQQAMRSGGKTGRLYLRRNMRGRGRFQKTKRQQGVGKGGMYYRASAPGQAPAVDQSELVNAIAYAVRRLSPFVLVCHDGIRTSMELLARAFALELGTDRAGRTRSVRIQKRPAFVTALEREKRAFPKRLFAALRGVK